MTELRTRLDQLLAFAFAVVMLTMCTLPVSAQNQIVWLQGDPFPECHTYYVGDGDWWEVQTNQFTWGSPGYYAKFITSNPECTITLHITEFGYSGFNSIRIVADETEPNFCNGQWGPGSATAYGCFNDYICGPPDSFTGYEIIVQIYQSTTEAPEMFAGYFVMNCPNPPEVCPDEILVSLNNGVLSWSPSPVGVYEVYKWTNTGWELIAQTTTNSIVYQPVGMYMINTPCGRVVVRIHSAGSVYNLNGSLH